MILLAIDTSAHICGVCLYDANANQVLAEQSVDIGRGHAEVLMGLIETCFSQTHLTFKDLDRIGVTIGPGSFTGVRVGLSVARGFGLSLGISTIGISTLEACEAYAYHDGALISLLDAKRGELYYKIAGEAPDVATYQELEILIGNRKIHACGAGASILNEMTSLDLPILHYEASAKIEIVAKLAAQKIEPSASPEPLYLRSADAKVQAGFALERI